MIRERVRERERERERDREKYIFMCIYIIYGERDRVRER